MREEKISMADQMRHHLEAFKSSGMFVEEYCKLQKIKPSAYYYWRKKLIGSVKSNTGSFIQLEPIPSVGCVEVIFPHGVKIQFSNLVPIDYLKQLVS